MQVPVSERPQKIFITSVVFNWAVGDFFISHTLPSLYAALRQLGGDITKFNFRIISTDRERLVIVRSDIYRKIEKLIDTEFLADALLPVDGEQVPSSALSEITFEAIETAINAQSAIFFLPAHGVLSTVSLKFLMNNLTNDCRAIFAPRVLIPVEAAKDKLAGDAEAAYSPHSLIGLALANWRRANARYVMDSPMSAIWKAQTAFYCADGAAYKLLDTPPVALFPRIEDDGCAGTMSSLVAKLPGKEFKAVERAEDFLIIETGIFFEDPHGSTSRPWRTLMRQLITQNLTSDSYKLSSLPLLYVLENSLSIDDARFSQWKNYLGYVQVAALFGSLVIMPLAYSARAMHWIARLTRNAARIIERILLSRCADLDVWDIVTDAAADSNAIVQPGSDVQISDITARENEIYSEIAGEVCGSRQAVVSLIRGVDYIVANDIPGAFVECGVFRDANIVAMIRRLQDHGISDREIYLYDTFEGMPRPDAIDTYIDGEPAIRVWEARKDEQGIGSDWVRCDIEDVQERVFALGYPKDKLHFVKGLVEETIPGTIPDSISLLRLDTDFYSSTSHELKHMYERLAPKGLLIIDDYGAFAGARQATDEFFEELGQRPYLARVDAHVRFIVKQ